MCAIQDTWECFTHMGWIKHHKIIFSLFSMQLSLTPFFSIQPHTLILFHHCIWLHVKGGEICTCIARGQEPLVGSSFGNIYHCKLNTHIVACCFSHLQALADYRFYFPSLLITVTLETERNTARATYTHALIICGWVPQHSGSSIDAPPRYWGLHLDCLLLKSDSLAPLAHLFFSNSLHQLVLDYTLLLLTYNFSEGGHHHNKSQIASHNMYIWAHVHVYTNQNHLCDLFCAAVSSILEKYPPTTGLAWKPFCSAVKV